MALRLPRFAFSRFEEPATCEFALPGDAHRRNLRLTYYEAGHMIYLDPASLAQLRRDAEGWFAR